MTEWVFASYELLGAQNAAVLPIQGSSKIVITTDNKHKQIRIAMKPLGWGYRLQITSSSPDTPPYEIFDPDIPKTYDLTGKPFTLSNCPLVVHQDASMPSGY